MYREMAESIINRNEKKAIELAKQVIEKHTDPIIAIESGFVKGLEIVGERFGSGQIFLPELFLSAKIMEKVTVLLEPAIISEHKERKYLGKVVLGTAEGDIHDLGKNVVAMLLRASGFKVFDLGVNVSSGKFIDEANRADADIIGMSALMSTTILQQRNLVQTLRTLKLREKFKVIVGGAATTLSWAEEIQADGYAINAVEAVKVAKDILKGAKP